MAAGLMTASATAQATVKQQPWGTHDGQPVQLYTLTDGALTVELTNFGAHVVAIEAPDRNGKVADIALGYNDLAGFVADTKTYMGSVVGRHGNRIRKGTFSLDGHTYHVPVNNNGNALHGGPDGFDRRVWTAQALPTGVEFTLVSADGDQGFPGKLTAHVRYMLTAHELHIEYSATTTKPTIVNLTNHTYFNLAGEASGTVLDQVLQIPADRYTPVDATQIPTGELAPVAGTPFDFRRPTPIGARVDADNGQLKIGMGYDHNWVLNGAGAGLHEAAMVTDPVSGRTLTVLTDQPGVQFYSGNFLDGTFTGRGDKPYGKYAGFCVETQHFPDSPNEPSFPSTELKPGQTLHSTTIFRFGVDK